MKFKKEIKTGVVVTLIIFLFLWGYNFLKGRNLFSSYNYYYATFPKVDGLQKSSAVDVNGFVVGLVSDIAFTSDKLDSLTVEIAVENKLKIPENTVIRIESDILGTKSVRLLPGNSSMTANSGDTLHGTMAPGMFEGIIDPFREQAEKLVTSVDSTLIVFRNIFDETAGNNIRSIVSGLEQMVSSERRKIGTILSDFASISGNLQKSNEDISRLIANLNAFSGTLAASEVKATIDNANSSLKQLHILLEGINAGQGTIGQLARNDSAYIFLRRSLEDLDKLLIDLRQNPKAYVHFSLFGKKSEK
ncbi:MAG: MlaD family protein [Bacteroidales bacterium]|jgi:phospholipid/cholesterol/gamma-HCH transport system substrate-binding protein|nr:MlaD family protein [Bacteroidales bacterium]